MGDIPTAAWRRRFDAPEPSRSVHTFARPSAYEALWLLDVAARVGSHIAGERFHGREPIFDLNGIGLEPPNPGPHAGVPLGGLGGGSIGRGYKGEFRRWSLNPGRYIHRNVLSDTFAIRVKRGDQVHVRVLSVFPPDAHSCLHSWDWSLSPSCATYHALFPRSWTVYDEPVPGVRVVVKQVSPFLPHSYSDASLPVGVFEVEVVNKLAEPAEVSVMFVFQNGFDSKEDTLGGYAHAPFHIRPDSTSSNEVRGVCLARHAVVNLHAGTHAHAHAHDRASLASSSSTAAASGSSSEAVVDQSSYAVAVSSQAGDGCTLSHCSQFITGTAPHSVFASMCAGATSAESLAADVSKSATNVWNDFRDGGDLRDDPVHRVSHAGTKVGAAVCARGGLAGSGSRVFSFALAWDSPVVRFKGDLDNPLRRYYSRFFGDSGLSSPSIAVHALLHVGEWEKEIVRWQTSTLERAHLTRSSGGGSKGDPSGLTSALTTGDSESPLAEDAKPTSSSSSSVPAADFYSHQLFNELYFLVDGGTVWTDTAGGVNNPQRTSSVSLDARAAYREEQTQHHHHQQQQHPEGDAGTKPAGLWGRGRGSTHPKRDEDHTLSTPLNVCAPRRSSFTHANCGASLEQLEAVLSTLSFAHLRHVTAVMRQNDSEARESAGDQAVVGQFLYLEGHEYLMYNTYDVHFYSSYALLMLWPQLELSLQRDFAAAVPVQDLQRRLMMGHGDVKPRKLPGVVPHDLGSPSDSPWKAVNAYNFQDVSNWKDLGPKFVLQIYRDYRHTHQQASAGSQGGGESSGATVARVDAFLGEMYPVVLTVMQSTEKFDLDGDGMIENSGFPDQTYDIWLVQGVSAYCGGLWIAACEAAAAMARLLGHAPDAHKYADLASRARAVYVKKLWNGKYLDYDSSSRYQHDSIMADMLAGQWYAHACDLPRVVSPQKALSCFRTIYDNNVVKFGGGRWMGAVNGMRPAKSSGGGGIDNVCLQSREVWTGTTYALAAGMIHEALRSGGAKDGDEVPLSVEERAQLFQWAHDTARGVHDAGWQEFGYWFATPEAWEKTGHYRSLGYMRPLSIWAIQFAKEKDSG